MLACFCSEKGMEEEVKDEQMEKVEMAFKKFDLDEDVFLSWEEFQQVHLSLSGILS
jgi:Ca2+-binding EF-hand superfamily protein